MKWLDLAETRRLEQTFKSDYCVICTFKAGPSTFKIICDNEWPRTTSDQSELKEIEVQISTRFARFKSSLPILPQMN